MAKYRAETVNHACGHEAWGAYEFFRRADYLRIVEDARGRKCRSCISASMPKSRA